MSNWSALFSFGAIRNGFGSYEPEGILVNSGHFQTGPIWIPVFEMKEDSLDALEQKTHNHITKIFNAIRRENNTMEVQKK